jgi:hypothetical protein
MRRFAHEFFERLSKHSIIVKLIELSMARVDKKSSSVLRCPQSKLDFYLDFEGRVRKLMF